MDQPGEIQEPFRSLLYNIGRPLPADFPQALRGRSLEEIEEGMPEDLQPNLPEHILDEITSVSFNQSLQAVVDESHEVLPDEVLQPLLDEFNETLPDDVPRPPRDVAIRRLRHVLVEQKIQSTPGLFEECHQIALNQYRQMERDRFHQFIQDGSLQSLADGFPQEALKMWRRLYPEIRDKYLTLEPEIDGMCVVADQVQIILQHLCNRDKRFSFIRSSIEELINGNEGLNDARKRLDSIIFGDLSELEDDVAMGELSKIIVHPTLIRTRDPADLLSCKGALLEIIDCAIYELLNVFQESIPLEQTPIDNDLMSHFELLCDLFTNSELLEPKPAIRQPPKTAKTQQSDGDKESHHYPSRLNSAIGEVRVLEILPGIEDEPIECRLVVRNLYDDGILEALSYVWGKDMAPEPITVDHKSFKVTKNLYGILPNLRRPDTTREIWVDAICINQTDTTEKTEQVKLMREIYTRAKSTVIWLSGGPKVDKKGKGPAHSPIEYPVENQREDKTFDMEGWYAPFPESLGGVNANQYDLAAILEEALEYSMDDEFSEKQWVLYIMLLRCAGLIMLYSWWEREWTIQEAACPPNAPTFIFYGYSFSFDDFTSAGNIATKLSAGNEHVTRQIENRHNVISPEVWQVIWKVVNSLTSLLSQGPLLSHYCHSLM